MDEAIYWIALKQLPKVGDITFVNLLKEKEDVKEIFKSYKCEHKIKEKALEFAKREVDRCIKAGINILKYNDENYPLLLKEIHSPPPFLYYIGDVKLLKNNYKIAIVGSRNPTNYGKNICKDITKDLVKFKIVTVSGFAKGIDSIVHTVTLNERGDTIAVLGNGLNTIYPASNKNLFYKIKEHGLILTEFSLDTKPEATNFPKRNRIISGLSKGVIVIEAGKKSGSLITAEFAINDGRDVFAVPGNVYSYKSKGTNFLIKNGAYLIENSIDVINNLFPEKLKISKAKKSTISFEDKNLELLYNLIIENPLTKDELVIKTGLNISELLVLLTNLQISGYIREDSGRFYVEQN